MYICPFFITISSSTIYFLSLSIFISVFFSSSTSFTIFLFLSCAFLIFFLSSFFSINISVLFIYSSLISIWSWLLFSILFCQSCLLLNPSTFPILFSGMCLRIKSNHNRYNIHLGYLLFCFWLIIKYWRFLWSIQISNFTFAPSK